MNCQLCQKEMDAYRGGTLPEGIRIQVEAHLESCDACAQMNQLIFLSDKVMDEEKNLQSNPFLVTRIMAGIEDLAPGYESYHPVSVFQKVLKSAIVAVSLAAAIFIGVVAGNLYKPATPVNKIPVEMVYLNDAALESVDLLTN